MTDAEMMEAMADSVAEFVQRSTMPLASRLAAVEARPLPEPADPSDAIAKFANALTSRLLA